MAKLNFRCARTGLNVQVWLSDQAPAVQADSYVTCPACARVHLVNKTSGRTLGDKESKVPYVPKTIVGNAANGIEPRFSPSRGAVRYIYRHARRFLKFLIARIDLSHFPGSCCG
jgi:hypothetical protein